MPGDAWTRRGVIRLAGTSILGGLAGCSGIRGRVDGAPTATRTRTATTTPTPRDSPTETPTPENSSRDAPGYKKYHWHGRLFFEVDGNLVDFSQPKYYLDNIKAEHPEAVYFHFHTTAHGPNEWSNEKKVVTFGRALDLLPGIEYARSGSGNHVVTYDGTTYSGADAGVDIGIYEGTRTIDPTSYEVQHGDNFWVRIDTGSADTSAPADGTRTGKLVFDVNNKRLNFEASASEGTGGERFQFRDDGKPYTWYNSGDPITLGAALDALPTVEYSWGSDGGHVVTYEAGSEYGGTYRSSDDGTEIIVRERATDVNPERYRLRDGDIVWVYVHTDRAPDNEH